MNAIRGKLGAVTIGTLTKGEASRRKEGIQRQGGPLVSGKSAGT